MLTQEIRRKFLKYFKDKDHTLVPSSPVIPHDDPTLLFINAGMNQFKDVFLGKSKRDYTKAASSQKCIRVGGKHNDLENVGHTLRHLTFFEMLGNFSFGDYFKKEAIQFAWEVSTEIFELDPTRIWPTVFRDDEEAFEMWTHYVPADRITRFGEKNNFWAMGDRGPCGPSSELLYDRGDKYGDAKNPLADLQETRYLEFWNLVFMQYNREDNGQLNPLPKPSIDTGAGLERVVNLKMGVHSVYETDVLRALIAKIENISGFSYQGDETKRSAAFRVIADHLRSLSFAISDGVQPSNVDRGYVLRKILRRAARYGRTLEMNGPFLAKIVPALLETMGTDYPELYKNASRIEEILNVEEEAFLRTLNRGGNILNQIIEKAQSEKRKITGEEAFKLKDTYGFPLEEILLLAKDADLSVDSEKYTALEEEAKERSRSAHKTTRQMVSENLFADYAEKEGKSEFVGYLESQTQAQVQGLVRNGAFVQEIPDGAEGIVLLHRTPFYAEMGGQVGDSGQLLGNESFFEVTNCEQVFKGIIGHVGKCLKGSIKVGDSLLASIDSERRQKIANNHTATHLLHWALSKVLGEHIKQAGSVVEPGRFRFDFSHHKSLIQEELRQIEDLINQKIRENSPVKSYELPFEDVSKREDIKQFFGEKYDKVVRVIDIDFSKELCGGTHTSMTGNIGLFRISKESSIAAGVRRIEACTGEEAEKLSRNQEDLLLEISEKLKSEPQKLLSRVEKLLEENKTLTVELNQAQKSKLEGLASELLRSAVNINEIPLITAEIQGSPDEARLLSDAIMNKFSKGVLVLGSSYDGKCQLTVRISDNFVQEGIQAKNLIASLAPIIGGGGGGKAGSAQAGGRFPEKIPEALNLAKDFLKSLKS